MCKYYYINQCEDNPQPGWRHAFHAEYTKKHPELHLTEQNFVYRKTDRSVDFNRRDIVLISRDRQNTHSTYNRYSSYLDP